MTLWNVYIWYIFIDTKRVSSNHRNGSLIVVLFHEASHLFDRWLHLFGSDLRFDLFWLYLNKWSPTGCSCGVMLTVTLVSSIVSRYDRLGFSGYLLRFQLRYTTFPVWFQMVVDFLLDFGWLKDFPLIQSTPFLRCSSIESSAPICWWLPR